MIAKAWRRPIAKELDVGQAIGSSGGWAAVDSASVNTGSTGCSALRGWHFHFLQWEQLHHRISGLNM
jgi:hypothetical protein